MRQEAARAAGGRCECVGFIPAHTSSSTQPSSSSSTQPSGCTTHPAGTRCAAPGSEADHHDDDYTNNTQQNIRWLCSACHERKTLAKAQHVKRAKRDAAKHSSARLQHPGLR